MIGLSLLGGLGLSFGFPRWDLFPVAWAALVPLLWASERTTRRGAFLLGWACGMGFFSATLSWVTISMHLYGKLPWIVSYLFMFLLTAYLSLFVGFFSMGFRWGIVQWGKTGALLAPFLWVALEMARARLFSGFPWAILGYSQYRFLHLIQISDVTGVYGISALLVLSNVSLWALLTRRRSGAWLAALFLFCLTGTLLYGKARLSEEMVDPTRKVDVGVVQGDIDQDRKWDARFREETLGIYERLSRRLLGESRGTRLLVWPESAAPFFFQQEGVDREKVIRLAREEGTYLLFGSPAAAFYGSGPVLYNSAYFLSPRGATLARYDKMHLVPFGEYVPLSQVLFFVNKMVEGIGDFESGTDYTLMTLPDVSFGTVICFEVIFPEMVRQFVDRGAGFMTTLTNDAWFGDSAAPYQHFSMVVFRSVENRVPFVRAANTGISGFIDPHGRILRQSPLFKESAFTREIHPGKFRTFYTRRGDLFGWGSVICVIMIFCAGAIVKPTRKEGIRK